MEPVIEIRNLSKQYFLGESAGMYGSFREVIVHALRSPWRGLRTSQNGNGHKNHDFWALRDISFDVHQGDTVGIIGANGAGKSTLLKIISRITDPTGGEAIVRGRMSSLLEVGTGFHPELTGRENVYLNGAILGMRRNEIAAKFDEIASFAGIDEFLDTPVKRYSSGMYVRLAFSVAAHLDPEVLIVDEVLAVGDVAFQKKCLGRMAEVSKSNRTVLFVSHNMAAIESLCNRVIVLRQGRILFSGNSREAVQHYLHNISGEGSTAASATVDLEHASGRPSKYLPQLKRLELYTEDGRPLQGELPVGSPMKAIVYLQLDKPCISFDAEIGFDTVTGQRVCTAHSAYEPTRNHQACVGEQMFVCEIGSLPLIPGEYKIGVGLHIMNTEVDCVDDATRIHIINSDYYGTGIVPTRGAFLLDNRWTLSESASPSTPPELLTY
jgi:lipopolysaccharide transport system ATP-binding protein